MPRLNRNRVAVDRDEIRVVHLGLGAFHRAHQAWYTSRASTRNVPGAAESDGWGIHGFTGRRPDAARELTAQDCLYTLITKSNKEVSAEVMAPIVQATDGADAVAWRAAIAAPAVSVITLTITEAGYHTTAAGQLDRSSSVIAADVELLHHRELPRTGLARLVDGLRARMEAESGPIAVMSCDNLPENGAVTARAVSALATDLDPKLAEWITSFVSFPSSMVDRITPATTPADVVDAQRLTGFADTSPVVTEDFTEWIFEGEFLAGRPEWERGGAQHVADVRPYEQRKLRLLNGAHSLLAYLGLAQGHATISQAIGDPYCAEWVERYWRDARPTIVGHAGNLDLFTEHLLTRFSNPRIEHSLRQISTNGETKIPVRIIPVLRAEVGVGRVAEGAAMALAAWIHFLANSDEPSELLIGARDRASSGAPRELVASVLETIAPDLAAIDSVAATVSSALQEIQQRTEKRKHS
jgi:fructuronate reductase